MRSHSRAARLLYASFLVVLLPLRPIASSRAASPDWPPDEAHPRCVSCHFGRSEIPGDSGEASARPDASVCVGCHLSAGGEGVFVARTTPGWTSGSGHIRVGPQIGQPVPPGGTVNLEKLDCLSCHTAHPSGNPSLLIHDPPNAAHSEDLAGLDATTRLCIRCHELFLQTEAPGEDYTLHPVGIPAPQMMAGGPGCPELPLADVLGTAETDDDVIACTTCHFPHDGPNPYLLRWSEDEMVAACKSCHHVREQPPADELMAARASSN